jgi:hypothetical protein
MVLGKHPIINISKSLFFQINNVLLDISYDGDVTEKVKPALEQIEKLTDDPSIMYPAKFIRMYAGREVRISCADTKEVIRKRYNFESE